MWRAYILLTIIPLYLYRSLLPAYGWQILSLLVAYPALAFLYDFFFSPLHIFEDLDLKYRKHRRQIGTGIPPPFPNGWFCLCYSFEVTKGQVKYIEALGEHFAIFRGESGKISVLGAYCPHLGANLAFGGKVKGDCLECPFHAWQFDSKGTCVSIPYSTGPIPSDAKTKSWICDEVSGQILVWYHAEDMEPHYYQDNYKEFNNGQMVYHGHSEQVISCHCQEIAENGPDWAHLNVIHNISVFHETIGHEWAASWKPCKGDKSYMTEIVVNESLRFLGFKVPFIDVEAQINQIGPGLVNLHFKTPLGNIYAMQTVVPIRPLLTVIRHAVWCDWKLPRIVGKVYLFNISGQVEKDIIVWSNKTYRVNPVLCRGDGNISGFRKWYSQFYSENSITLQDFKDKMMDW